MGFPGAFSQTQMPGAKIQTLGIGLWRINGKLMALFGWVGKALSCTTPKVIVHILSWSFTGGRILTFFIPECETYFPPELLSRIVKGNPVFIEGL